METAFQALCQVVTQCAPRSVVTCGEQAGHVGEHWHAHSQADVIKLDRFSPKDPFSLPNTPDLALISDTLEHWDRHRSALLLGQLRNYGTHQIAVLVGDTPDWAFKDFIGLGFRRHAEIQGEAGTLTLYTYNLDTYNHKRAWNNPDNWANPEMWGKAWW